MLLPHVSKLSVISYYLYTLVLTFEFELYRVQQYVWYNQSRGDFKKKVYNFFIEEDLVFMKIEFENLSSGILDQPVPLTSSRHSPLFYILPANFDRKFPKKFPRLPPQKPATVLPYKNIPLPHKEAERARARRVIVARPFPPFAQAYTRILHKGNQIFAVPGQFLSSPVPLITQRVLLYEPSADPHDFDAASDSGDAAGVITSPPPHNRSTFTLTSYFAVCDHTNSLLGRILGINHEGNCARTRMSWMRDAYFYDYDRTCFVDSFFSFSLVTKNSSLAILLYFTKFT